MSRSLSFCIKSVCVLTSSVLFSLPSLASLDAVKLDLVPSDILVDCNRSFFKGSAKDNRALFVTPHIVAGRSPIDGDGNEIHITTTPEKGKYLMSIGVFFPRDGEDSKNSHEIRDSQANFCNFESVRHFINEAITNEDEKFDKVVHIPLTSIEIKIAGIKNHAHIIGRIAKDDSVEDVDILEYNDKSYTAEFVIDDAELDYINEHMNRDEGMQLDVTYRFQSRKKDGSIDVKIDAQDIATNFKAAAQGKKYIFKGQLQATLQTAIAKSNIEISINAGRDEAFNAISQKIVDQVLSSVDFKPAPREVEAEKIDSEKTDDKVVEVSVVMQAIVSKVTKELSYEYSTLPETTTAQTTVRIKNRPIDPRVYELSVNDGLPPTDYPTQIRKGETVKIKPAYSFITRRAWKERVSYVTINQMETLGVFNAFLLSGNTKMVLSNEEVNGRLIAQGQWYGAYFFPMPWNPYYRWKRIQRYPVRATRAIIKLYNVDSQDDLEYVPVSVAFSKVGGGYERFELHELLDEKELFEAKLKRGTIVLTAKEDLGIMTFREHVKRPYYEQKDKDGKLLYPQTKEVCTTVDKSIKRHNRTIVDKEEVCQDEYMYDFKASVRNLDEVVQEQHNGMGFNGSKTDSDPQPIRGRVDRWALEMYQTIVLAITRPSKEEADQVDEKVITSEIERGIP